MFKKMEELDIFSEYELGLYCYLLTIQLQMKGNNTEKVLSFGKKALERFTSIQYSNNNIPCAKSDTHFHHLKYAIGHVLDLLGFASFDLNRYYECLSYSKRADKILSQLEKEGNDSCPGNCVLEKLGIAQFSLFTVKTCMGRSEEAVTLMRKVLEIREKTKEEGCMELGETYKDVYKAYFAAVDIKEVLPFCLKALEIYKKHLGCDSLEVAKMMGDLGHIYSELGECEKALELNMLAQSVMKKMAPDSLDLLQLENVSGGMLRDVGRFEEAIEVFTGVISHAEADVTDKANAFAGMAKASYSLGKFDDVKEFMRTVHMIYEKEEMDPVYVVCGFEDMSRLYEEMNDLETAISLAKRVLAIPKIPQKLLLEASGRLFTLISLVGKEKEAVQYMEDVMEKLKDRVGSKHYNVAYGYKVLGGAYLKSDQAKLALKCLMNAKDIMDVHHGPDHLESLEINHKLAVTYAVMKRVELAIELEEKVVVGLKGMGPSVQRFLDEAVELLKHLNELKEIMAGPAWPLINVFANLMK